MEKYDKALIALSEILLEKSNAEIEALIAKLEYIEQHADKGGKA